MAYSADTQTKSGAAVSLTRAALETPQRVSVVVNGFDYPGEVIFAGPWQAWFGAEPPERTMFRLVLLSESQRVDVADISGTRVLVAVPEAQNPSDGSPDLLQLDREIGRLNEIRERYVTSNDAGLSSLASSITSRASEVQSDIARAMADRWRSGRVITESSDDALIVSADAIFVGDDPATWIEAAAAALFTRSHSAVADTAQLTPPELFDKIVSGNEAAWRESLDASVQTVTGAGLDEVLAEISRVASGSKRNRLSGPELRRLLLRRYGMPPGLASLILAAFMRRRDGEAGITRRIDGTNRLDAHSLKAGEFDPDLVFALEWLSAVHIADWNSALAYAGALLPHAESSDTGVPSEQLEEQLAQVLQVTGSRNRLTIDTIERVASGSARHVPDLVLAIRLQPVLEADEWRSFYAKAREVFPAASEFADALAASSRLRLLSEDVVDLQAARDYVATADCGTADRALALDAETLLHTLDVTRLLLNQSSASAELEKFQRWKRRFTSVYITHHAKRRSADLELSRRVARAETEYAAVRKLSVIPELDGILDPAFDDVWSEVKDRVKPCPKREDEVALQRFPYCDECGVRLSSTGADDEAERCISEISQMLRQTSDRLGKIAASRVLSGEREEELRQLIAINSIADLTAISNILEDGVPAFLERFASKSPGGAV